MKSRGFFSSFCHNLDCIEDEMRGLCGFLGRICAGGRRKDKCKPCKKSPCDASDFCKERCDKCEKHE